MCTKDNLTPFSLQDAEGRCVIPPDVIAANASGDITLWVPMMPFVAGRADIPKRGGSGKVMRLIIIGAIIYGDSVKVRCTFLTRPVCRRHNLYLSL
jgi:hypothetical protein